MSKHTEWTMGGITPCGSNTFSVSVYSDSSPPGEKLPAEVYGRTPEMAKSRARLIAAAPDLLAACECFAEWLRQEEQPSGIDRAAPGGEEQWQIWYDGKIRLCEQAQHLARAAITKATTP